MSACFTSTRNGNRMMLGFIVRRCAKALGHSPTPEEFAAWANNQEQNGKRYSLFGQAISASTAEIMLRHLSRVVTVRSEGVVNSKIEAP